MERSLLLLFGGPIRDKARKRHVAWAGWRRFILKIGSV
jgi:hypothetical protein